MTNSDTPRTDALWVDPNKIGVNGTIAALDALARTLERELTAEKERSERLEKALREIMHARKDPSVALTNMSRAGMREIAAAALGDSSG